MGRLFDKFLISTINQRLPMPPKWQNSLGLSITDTKQNLVGSGGCEAEHTGYKFQRDDPLNRGFISGKILQSTLEGEHLYRIALFLQALKNHKNLDYIRYFKSSTTEHNGENYITTISVIDGEDYTILGNTELPISWKYYSTASGTLFAEGEQGSLYNNLLIGTSYYNEETAKKQSEQEYFVIEVKSYKPLIILQGRFDSVGAFFCNIKDEETPPNIFETGEERLKGAKTFNTVRKAPFISSIENNKLYSNKLIPALLDIQITENSNQSLIDTLPESVKKANQLQKGITDNTYGLHELDEYIGENFIW